MSTVRTPPFPKCEGFAGLGGIARHRKARGSATCLSLSVGKRQRACSGFAEQVHPVQCKQRGGPLESAKAQKGFESNKSEESELKVRIIRRLESLGLGVCV